LFEVIRSIDSAIQLFLYVTEEGKISSDLAKLRSIIDQRSSLDSGRENTDLEA